MKCPAEPSRHRQPPGSPRASRACAEGVDADRRAGPPAAVAWSPPVSQNHADRPRVPSGEGCRVRSSLPRRGGGGARHLCRRLSGGGTAELSAARTSQLDRERRSVPRDPVVGRLRLAEPAPRLAGGPGRAGPGGDRVAPVRRRLGLHALGSARARAAPIARPAGGRSPADRPLRPEPQPPGDGLFGGHDRLRGAVAELAERRCRHSRRRVRTPHGAHRGGAPRRRLRRRVRALLLPGPPLSVVPSTSVSRSGPREG